MMKKLLFLLIVLSASGFAATCPTAAAGSGYCDITVTPTDPWGNGSTRRFYRVVPTGWPTDGTGTIIVTLNGSSLASLGTIGQIMATNTTGWDKKCALVSPKCVVIGPDPLTASRYHIERVDCGAALGTGGGQGCTIRTRELNPSGGGNTTIAQLAGACSGINSSTAVTATFVDNQTVTTTNAGTCSETNPSAFAEIGSQNGSFAGLMRAEPSDSVDDLSFIREILLEQIPILVPNKNSIFCVGWSAGAFLCSNLATQMPDMLAAIGMAEGAIGTQHYNGSRTFGTIGTETDIETNFNGGNQAVSLLTFSGTTDTTVINCGGGVHNTFAQQNSLLQTLQFYVAQNHETTVPAYPCTTGTIVAPSSAVCNAARTTAGSFTTTASTTIARAAGSFVADGYANNDYVALRGFSNAQNNGAVCKVTAVAALSLTVTGCTLTSEGPTAATLDDNETIVFTLPSSPVSAYGFSTSPPNNGARWNNMGSTTYQQGDCNISGSTAGATITTHASGLGACWSTAAQLACVPGAIAVGSGTIQPRPYLPTANNQISWLATGGDDGTEIQAYSLNGGGHTYWGGYSATGVTYTLAAGASTITRSGGSFNTDVFTTGDIVGMSSAGGWTTNAGTRCTATVTSATVLTLASCSAALVDEVTGTSAYVTDNVIDGMNSNITGAQNETDVFWTFFQAHKKASGALTHRGRTRGVVGTRTTY